MTNKTESPALSTIYLLFVTLSALIILILFYCRDVWSPKTQILNVTANVVTANPYDIEYNACINQLTKTETLSKYVVLCPAGNKTIGYGHKLNPLDDYTTIGVNDAKSLLIADFEYCIRAAERFGYVKANNKQLAVAHAIFCLGEDRFMKFINKHSFFYEICQLNGYFCGNKFKQSKSIQDSRHFEIQLFYYR
jgi:GH24 family phage-related lysozyme (muramidase)